MYENVLDRDPSTNEVDGWAQALQAGADAYVVSLDFVNSEENVSNLITADYRDFFNRTPSASERNFWVQAASGQTDPRTQLIVALLGSPEGYADES